MQTITPFLWFDGCAEEAARLYTSTFPDSKITDITRWKEGGPAPAGSVMTVTFQLRGQEVTALNGGPTYQLTPAFSFVVSCETQEEVDRYWSVLTADGGREQPCGWLVDRFGLSWQIIPRVLLTLINDKDAAKAGRAVQAMLQMKKIDIARMEQAFKAA